MTDEKPKDDKAAVGKTSYASVMAQAALMPWMIGFETWRVSMQLAADWWKAGLDTINDPDVQKKTYAAQTAYINTWIKSCGSLADLMGGQFKTLYANPWVKQWIKYSDEQFERWDMPRPGATMYNYSKKMLEQQMGFMPPVLRAYVKAELSSKEDNQIKDLLHNSGIAGVLNFVGQMAPGRGELSKPEYNHKFLTEDSHGKIHAVSPEEIDKLFPRTNGQGKPTYPHIIITSSHAKGEKLKDMTDITHGIEALARESHGKPLNIAHVNGKISGKADNSLILFACDTEKNPFMNAAALMKRLDDLQRIAKTGEADTFENASPGAKRIAKLMLRCMAQNPNDVDVNDERSLSEIGSTLQLRARPELIAQHFQLIGYSKGGNVVSDAMRYLVTELTAKDASGNNLIQMNDEGPTPENVRNLVRNIACMSIAALEVPMEKKFKEAGVRRVSFNNENDLISNHMHFEDTWGDKKWLVKGVEHNQGHDPQDAMGKLERDIDESKRNNMNEQELKKAMSGYLLDDPRVARRMKEAFAPLYGKAAISSISFIDPKLEGNNQVLIGTAPGTPDDLFEKYSGVIVKTMEKAGLKNVEVKNITQHNGRAFVLSAEGIRGDDPEALKAMYEGFQKLRDPGNVDGLGLLIADDIMERIIPARAEYKKWDIDFGIEQGRSAA